MATILMNRRLPIPLAIASFALLVLSTGAYCGSWTGYAHGNRNGASGQQVFHGDFATHPAGDCDDPAGNWAFGTGIALSGSSINIPHIYGTGHSHTAFYKKDNGDPAPDPDNPDEGCHEKPYWIDVYFGRWTPWPDDCNCEGSPEDGYCELGKPNDSCVNAHNFGRSSRVYNLLTLPPCGC
jgi:hypothetical protein